MFVVYVSSIIICVAVYMIYRQKRQTNFPDGILAPKAEESPRIYDQFQAPEIRKPPIFYNVKKCGICFDQIETERQEITFLKCGHVYHDECIAKLISKHLKHCPQCRQDVEFYNCEKSKYDCTTINHSPDDNRYDVDRASSLCQGRSVYWSIGKKILFCLSLLLLHYIFGDGPKFCCDLSLGPMAVLGWAATFLHELLNSALTFLQIQINSYFAKVLN